MITYLEESVEFQEVIVRVDGEKSDNFQVALVPIGERPTVWEEPTVLSGKRGVMIEGLPIGQYWIFARVRSEPETPVLLAGVVNIA